MASVLAKYKKVYMVGIKGVGMTMLAQFLKEKGSLVTGSDIPDTFLTDKVLKKEKIKVFKKFDVKNISSDVNLVIHSSAYNPENNIELAHLVKQKKVRVLNYASALGEIFSSYQGISVCGSHGKTTTSAWLGYVLSCAKLEPNVLVGSSVPQFKSSGLIGKSNLFVAETDEYQNKLQYFQPYGVVLNNIDYDHPDFFKTKAAYFKVFKDFVNKIPKDGFLVANDSDKQIRSLYGSNKGWLLNYDFVDSEKEYLKKKAKVKFVAYDYHLENGYQYFKVNDLGEFKIKMLGRHNVFNALAVIAAAYALGLEVPVIKKHLATFLGTTRRAQYLGDFKTVPIFDDYAHHPTEVKSTIEAFKEAYPNKKLVLVFHPHTFTRTLALFNDFKKSFVGVHKLIIIDIYGSAREKQGGTSSKELIKAVQTWNKEQGIHQKVVHQTDLVAVEKYLRDDLQNGDLLLFMGAGDIFRVGEKLLKKLI